ncbi:MAG: replication initiation protein RepC [bacterium]|nr:replication initiation protein RepC [bacterium]
MTNQSATPGLRTITPEAIAGRRAAAHFDGLPAGVDESHLERAIRKGAPGCGYTPAEVRRLVYLVRHTRSGDWQDGDGLPVVWKSVAVMAEDLGIGRRQVSAVERSLAAKGAIAHRDWGSRRRWGRRDPETGRVTQAYGVDLRPLAGLYEQFDDAARAAADDERSRKAVRGELLALRFEVRQIAAAAGRECDLGARPLEVTAARAALVAERDRLLELRDALIAEFPGPGGDRSALGGCEIEESHGAGETGCRCGEPAPMAGGGGEAAGRGGGRSSPAEGEVFVPHILVHSESVPNGNRPSPACGTADPAVDACSDGPPDPAGDTGPGRDQPRRDGGGEGGPDTIDIERDFGVQHLQPGRVAAVASPAFGRIVGDDPGWRELRWGGEQQRLALGIHDRAWRRAIDVLGIRAAVVLVAVIDGRCQDKASFVWNPSGFVVGCVKRAETGDLHLHRSVWGLERTLRWRDARWAYAVPRSGGEAVR